MKKRGLFISALALSLLLQSTGGITTYASKVDDIKIDSNIVVFVGDSYLSVRESATSSSTELGRLNSGASAIKTGEKDGDWIEVKSGDVKGWVYEPYTISGNKLNDYIVDNLEDFDVDVQVNKASGQYTSIKSLKNDDLKYDTKITFPKENITVYKTNKLTDKIKGEYETRTVCVVTGQGVRVREEPDKDGKVLDIVDKDKEYNFVSSSNNDWYEVKYKEGKHAFIRKSLSKLADKEFEVSNIAKVDYVKNMMYDAKVLDKGVVQVTIDEVDYYTSIDDVYLFYRAYETSSAVSVANETQTFNLKEINTKKSVYKVEEVNKSTGSSVDLYMSPSNTDLVVKFDKAEKIEVEESSDSGSGSNVKFVPKSTKSKYVDKYNYKYDNSSTKERNKIVNYALQFLGHPYVYGGTSLTNGIDCSAFVQKMLQHFGKDIGRCTATQVSESNGKKIDAEDIQPGDLIYYTRDGVHPYHVVMYLGGDNCIHASCEAYGVCIGTIKKDRILMIKNYID